MKKLITIFAIISIPLIANAQWNYVNKVDDFTDEVTNYAYYLDENYYVQISYEGSRVWMYITVEGLDLFEPDGIIELRVDDNEATKIDPEDLKELEKYTKEKAFNWEPQTVGFLIWHGQEKDGMPISEYGFIGQLLEGDLLRFRYQTSSMGRKSYQISLDDAKEAILNGLKLKEYKN